MSMILSEAFKELKFLSEDAFELNDEGIDELKNFVDSDEEDDTVDVIDPKAESEEDLEDSYLGKVILDCAVCHSKVYKDAEDVKVEEGDELANTDEECPFCYTTDGFKVIGQVANYQPLDDIKVEVEDDDGSGQAEVKVKAEESLKSRKSRKGLSGKLNEAKDGNKYIFNIPDWLNDDDLSEDEVKAEIMDFCGDSCTIVDYIHSNCNGNVEATVESSDLEALYRAAREYYNSDDEAAELLALDNDMDEDELYSLLDIEVYDDDDDYDESLKEGIFDFGKKKKLAAQKQKEAKKARKQAEIDEALDSVEIKADGQKYTIKAEPNEEVPREEVIAPITPEVEGEITANSEGEADVEVDDFSEEEFDDLGESYLKEVYDNVKSYKTSGVTSKGNKLTVEGVITFNSGKQKKTQFVFEAKDITKRGKARFIGENKQICRGSKAFTLTGSIKSGKFLSESFNYNYRADGSKRVYGTIKRK